MILFKKIRKLINDHPLSLTLLCYVTIVLFYVWENSFLPSIDGPAHIHNSLLLKEYLIGNSVIHQNYMINDLCTPNLFSNYYLAILMTICGTLLALKVFYFSLLFFSLLSVRYFLSTFISKGIFLPSMAFVLLYNSFLLNIGFYNFSFSIIFLLFSIGFYHRNLCASVITSKRNYLVYFLLLILLYYSNALSFVIFIGYITINKFNQLMKLLLVRKKAEVVALFKQLVYILLFTVPFGIMLYVFQSRMGVNSNYSPVDLSGNWKNLMDFSSFIVYDRTKEGPISFLLFMIILFLFIVTLFIRITVKRVRPEKGDLLLVFMILALALYFILPDNYSVGMMSNRLQYFIYLFLLLWLFIQPGKYLKYIVAACLFTGSVYKHIMYQRDIIHALDTDAKDIVEASKYINPNKTVAVLNYSGNWLVNHFPNYIGVCKPMIILENYEAYLTWFPLRWNNKRMPTYTISGQKKFENYFWNSFDGNPIQEVDYIFIYCGVHLVSGNTKFIELLKNYERTDQHELKGIAIYKHK